MKVGCKAERKSGESPSAVARWVAVPVAAVVAREVSCRVSSELEMKPKKPVVARLLAAGYKVPYKVKNKAVSAGPGACGYHGSLEGADFFQHQAPNPFN
jgi:hypothetical protein